MPSEQTFWSNGISARAICDGATPQFRNEELAVVGGGDSACEEAVYLTKYGSHVHLVVRSDKLRASAAMADRVLANDSITVHWNSEIDDVSGDDWMQSMTLRNRILSPFGICHITGREDALHGCFRPPRFRFQIALTVQIKLPLK